MRNCRVLAEVGVCRLPLEDMMWVEKYRPEKLEDLVNQESVKQRLKQLLERKEELPHLLFAGPPG